MQYITSKENSLIKNVKKLKEKKHRVKEGLFLIEGFRFIEEAIKSSYNVKYIFIDESSPSELYDKYIKKYNLNDSTYMVSKNIFNAIASTETPQGSVAVIEDKKLPVVDCEGFYVLVDKVQDPGNLGTIIRTAHASGSLGIIMTKGTVDIYNEKTLRSTMGSIFNIPIIEDKDLSFVNELRNKGFKVITSSLDTENNFYDVDLSGKVIISVGNEGNGISEEIYNISDEKVKIPMPGGAESLNVSVASAIMMYEVVRQKDIKVK